MVVIAEPGLCLLWREPLGVKADRLQPHRLALLDAVDEIHAITTGAILPPESVKLPRVDQSRRVLVRVWPGLSFRHRWL